MNKTLLLIVALLMLLTPTAVLSSPVAGSIAGDARTMAGPSFSTEQVVTPALNRTLAGHAMDRSLLACSTADRAKCGPGPCRFK